MASHLHTRSPVAKFVQNRCNYLAAEELLMSNHKEKKKKTFKTEPLHKLITGLTLNYMTLELNTAQKNLYYNKDGQQDKYATTELVMKIAFRLGCRSK